MGEEVAVRGILLAGLSLGSLLAPILAGCIDPRANQPSPDSPRVGSERPEQSPEVSLRVVDEVGLQQAIDRHRGDVVLVDFWATWCTSCVEMFPHTVGLHRDFAHQGLAVISVSFDDPQSEPRIRQFLESQGATFENFISRHGASPDSTRQFQIEDDTLPNVKIYDRQGKLQKTFSGGEPFEEKDIDQVVQRLLRQP